MFERKGKLVKRTVSKPLQDFNINFGYGYKEIFRFTPEVGTDGHYITIDDANASDAITLYFTNEPLTNGEN